MINSPMTKHRARNAPAEICPCCGQVIIVPEDLQLPPIKRRIFEAVQHHPGIGAEELRTVVWADDLNGGPECRHSIYVHIHQLNRLLAPLGIIVRAPKGAGAGYRILGAS